MANSQKTVFGLGNYTAMRIWRQFRSNCCVGKPSLVRNIVVSALLSSAILQPALAGPDVILGELDNLREYARTDAIAAFSVATTSCNAGDTVLKWDPLPKNTHPIITMNLYRLLDSRMEQIGQSWAKHGFFALQHDVCNLGCQPASGNGLGVGCSDPYGAMTNQGPNLGSRTEVNPFTGHFDGASANDHQSHDHSEGISHGLQVPHGELGRSGARYFVEGHYITPDDALAGNGTNNASYREVGITETEQGWLVSNKGLTTRRKSAIEAWEGAYISKVDTDDDGRIVVASKVTQLEGGQFRYDYAVYNMNSDRGIRALRLPLGDVAISNIGSSHPLSHGEAWSNDPWSVEVSQGGLSWSTARHANDPNANAVRWGNTYNFWFESPNPPQLRLASLLRFKPGSGSGTLIAEAHIPVSLGKSRVLSGVNNRPPEELSEEGRLLVGRALDYSPSTTDAWTLFAQLKASMAERRKLGWKVVEAMLQPHEVLLADGEEPVDVPRWQTWYEGTGHPNEIQPMLELYFDKLMANPGANLSELADQTLGDFGQKKLAERLTDERFEKELFQFLGRSEVPAEFEGRGNTIFSTSFMKHVMENAQAIEDCASNIPGDLPPPAPDNFSHCFPEFPRSAVMVKTRWQNLNDGAIQNHDTSGGALNTVIVDSMTDATWPGVPATENPNNDDIYVNISREGTRWGLTGIHFVTKDVREWVWVSLWWSPNAENDFGADRPETIGQFNDGVWKNYKMCVVSSFAEGDAEPWKSYETSHPSLSNALQRSFEATKRQVAAAPHNEVTTWCSNPFIEFHAGNARTSCIGCHQYSQTDTDFGAVLTGVVPQFGRSRNRLNFSADFSFGIPFEFRGARGAIANARTAAGFDW